MTLGALLPAVLLFIAFTDIPIFMFLRARGMMKDRLANILSFVSLSLPLLTYGILRYVMPDIGAMEVM